MKRLAISLFMATAMIVGLVSPASALDCGYGPNPIEQRRVDGD